ncbi:hypothetical protein ZWY2020_058458 [Hordeum vulgare]|nr:hypothetical protein ZWY2020_058458 [Hordeum vulgare]
MSLAPALSSSMLPAPTTSPGLPDTIVLLPTLDPHVPSPDQGRLLTPLPAPVLLSPPLPYLAPASPLAWSVVGIEEVATPDATQPDPPRSAAYSRRVRSAQTPMTASRHRGRVEPTCPVDHPTSSLAEQAELRAMVRNLETGTLVIRASSASCSFSDLE